MSVGPASAPRPIHPDRTGSANARESPLGFHVCHVPKDRDRLESRRRLALIGGSDAPRTAPSLQGVGKHGRFRPFTEAVVIGSALRHSAFRGRGGGGARAGRGVTGGGGLRAARSRLGRESQVRRTRVLGARSRHAGESPRRRGGRCRDTGAAAGAAARTRRSARRPQRPPRLRCPGSLREPPTPRPFQ